MGETALSNIEQTTLKIVNLLLMEYFDETRVVATLYSIVTTFLFQNLKDLAS